MFNKPWCSRLLGRLAEVFAEAVNEECLPPCRWDKGRFLRLLAQAVEAYLGQGPAAHGPKGACSPPEGEF